MFEDVTFRGNYFIYPGYGWRIHNQTWNGTGYGSVGSNCEGIASSEMVFTGPVVIENNFFYHAAGPMIRYIGSALKDNAPTLKGNTFIQSEEQLLFVTFDNDHEENSIGVPAVDTQITRFRECSGDEMAEVRIVKGE